MTKTPPTFLVTLDDDTEHVVQVLHPDQLRAELEAPRNGIPVKFEQAPVHHTTLWVWAGLRRQGVTDLGFQDFLPRIRLIGRPPGDAAGEDAADPTPPVPDTERP